MNLINKTRVFLIIIIIWCVIIIYLTFITNLPKYYYFWINPDIKVLTKPCFLTIYSTALCFFLIWLIITFEIQINNKWKKISEEGRENIIEFLEFIIFCTVSYILIFLLAYFLFGINYIVVYSDFINWYINQWKIAIKEGIEYDPIWNDFPF